MHNNKRLMLSMCVCIFVIFLSAFPLLAKESIIYETDSLYHHIVVTEDEQGRRFLAFNRTRGHQSGVVPDKPQELLFGYVRSTFLALGFLDKDPEDILLVGLGGASMPMYMRLLYPEVKMDLAEIDPEVVRVAQEYLYFKPDDKMNVIIQDGRSFLRRTPQKYDLIILDAYNDSSVPFHLTTREFLEIVKERLKPGAVVASNVWSISSNRYFTSQIKTYQAVFSELYLMEVKGTGNTIFIASAQPGRLSQDNLVKRCQSLLQRLPFNFDLAHLAATQYNYITDRAVQDVVLTDDYAPVDLLRHQKPVGQP